MKKSMKEHLAFAVAVVCGCIYYAPEAIIKALMKPFAIIILVVSFVPVAVFVFALFAFKGVLIFLCILGLQISLAYSLATSLAENEFQQKIYIATNRFVDSIKMPRTGHFLF